MGFHSGKKTDSDSQVFTTRQFIESLQKINPAYGERKAYRTLENLQKRGRITKVSRGHYTFKITRRMYSYKPDAQMRKVIRSIERKYPACDFQIWRVAQFNEFLEHDVPFDALFVEVTHSYEEKVQDLLGSDEQLVMRNPDLNTFMHYRTDNVIIVKRLNSDCPSPLENSRQASLEKMIVDLFSRKLSGWLIPHDEYEKIIEEAFSRYAINEKSMFRYARRRNLEKEIRSFIAEETLIHLMI